MGEVRKPLGRREQAKRDKKERIMAAARDLFAERGIGGVTTQQVADHANVAIGTLYLYATTKAELLIMVQNQKFAAAIDAGLAAAAAKQRSSLEAVIALIRPVVACVREHVENGRTYLHELVFGDPSEPYRREGLALSARLEDGVGRLLMDGQRINNRDAATLARVITAIVHISTTATIYLHRNDDAVLSDIREQVRATLGSPTSPEEGTSDRSPT